MSSKYLSAGQGTWTASSRTITAATMSPVFDSTDQAQRRAIFFRIGSSVYASQVEAYLSASSVILSASGVLPGSNGLIDEILMVDLGLSHSFAEYVAEIKRKVKADEPKFPEDDVKKVLAAAVADYSHDRPLLIAKKVAGNGTNSLNLVTLLGGLWKHGTSQILKIEYPVGSTPPLYVDSDDYDVLDDGTAQDGSNVALVFTDGTAPSASEHLTVHFSTPLSLPEAGLQNFPDTDENFENITTLASSYACQSLATVYATSKDAVISADVVNYNDKSRKYQDLGKMYLKKYCRMVFGSEEPASSMVAPASVEKELESRGTWNQTRLFH
jgi:hypothetical protein